jgi:NADH-quinone oxidoreductase subunit M
MLALGAIGIVYGALLAMVQKDLKKLAAYGTLGHVSVVILGIFAFTISGIDGGIYQTLNEGIGGSALFMLLGLLYERYRTYDMREYGGLAARLPWIVTMFVVTALSVTGLPMLNGFVGEFLVFSGTMQSAVANHLGWAVLATSSVILTASYMLWMIQRIFYGDLSRRAESVAPIDLTAREHLALWPLVALFLFMGIASPVWLRAIDTTGARIAETVNRSQAVTVNFDASSSHRGPQRASSPGLSAPAQTSETAINMTTASSATKGAR